MAPYSRRDFIAALAALGSAKALSSCGAVVNPGGPAGSSGGVVAAGNVSSLAVGALTRVPGDSVVIARDSGGVYAMSTICTHQGCDMSTSGQITSQGEFCACHGSQFNANGDVVRGPANSPLPHYAVSVDSAGAITIDTGQTVAPSTRTPA